MVGYSWVSRLQSLDLLPPEFSYLGYGGASFASLAVIPLLHAVFVLSPRIVELSSQKYPKMCKLFSR